MIAIIIAAAAVCILVVALRHELARRWLVVTVHGDSMSPTLRNGQRIVARRGHAAATGDIIVFELAAAHIVHHDDTPHRVKRVAAVAGDPVPAAIRDALGIDLTTRVPPGHVVVIGDNPRSQDSRHLGFIAERSILAVLPGASR